METLIRQIETALEFGARDRLAPVLAGGASLLVIGALISRRKRGFVLASMAVLLRGACLAILGLLVLEPFVRVEERHPGIFLGAFDLSRSVDRAERNAAWDAVRDAVTGDPAPRRVVFGFGERDRVLDLDRPLPDDEGFDLASDPRGALDALVMGPEVAADSARFLIASDGALPDPTDIPPLGSTRPLVVALGGGEQRGMTLDALNVVAPPDRGKPVQLSLRGSATRGGLASVVLRVDGREVRRAALTVEAGPFEVPLTTPALAPGVHVIGAMIEGASEDDPLDNRAATTVRIGSAPKVLLVTDDEEPLVLAALKAQEIEVERVGLETLAADPTHAPDAGVLILDRVAASELSRPALLDGLEKRIERGGGLLYLPPMATGELHDPSRKPFLRLLPLVGLPPPPPPEPEKPEPPKPDPDATKPPDPEKPRKKEKRKAPSLGLMLVVDASSSMKDGGRLRLAKEAAIAAAEVLHPKDLVGVIHFNRKANVVLQLTPSGDKATIVDRIARIRAGGGTRFKPALQLAEELFLGEELAIRHVILLSDGVGEPDALKPLVTGMANAGITVSTVGCGGGFDENTLSDIAHWGQGRFHPAFDANEIPQIFTIEAERVIKTTGARHRRDAEPKPESSKPDVSPPKPQPEPERDPPPAKKPEPPPALPFQLGLPAAYLGGVTPHDVPGLLGLHPTRARTGAWVSLETTEARSPVLAHQALGYGRVASFALPLQGPWAGHLVGWSDYQTLLAQLVRFLHPQGERRRFHVAAAARGRAIDVRVLDRQSRTPPADLRVRLADAQGGAVDARIERLAADRFLVRLASQCAAAGVVVSVVDGNGASYPGGADIGFAAVPPPPEVADGGLDLPGLQSWAGALGGTVAPRVPKRIDVPARITARDEPFGAWLLPWLLAFLCLDLLLRRLWPGRLE